VRLNGKRRRLNERPRTRRKTAHEKRTFQRLMTNGLSPMGKVCVSRKVMRIPSLVNGLVLVVLSFLLACGSDETLQQEASDTPAQKVSATILGTIADVGAAAKGTFQAADSHCPEVIVTLNGSPAQIVIADDCAFLISDVEPSQSITLRIELPDQGITGTIELQDIVEGELIEILLETSFDSLTISVVRREEPEPAKGIPEVITGNNVTMLVPAGLYDQPLTVLGNHFTLVGEGTDNCEVGGWTIIDGRVVINGNNATFRNIAFDAPVEVRGNNTHFINCCFDGVLLVFGNGTDIDDGHWNNDACDDDDDGCYND
jgi:hypothetical protein